MRRPRIPDRQVREFYETHQHLLREDHRGVPWTELSAEVRWKWRNLYLVRVLGYRLDDVRPRRHLQVVR